MKPEIKEPSVWRVRTAAELPDSESWLHQPAASAALQQSLSWAQNNAPSDSNIATVIKKLARG